MGILSMSEEIKIKLVDITNGIAMIKITKQLCDGPYYIDDPRITSVRLNIGEETTIK